MARLEVTCQMLTYSFAGTGSDSLYEHLYKCIRNDILCGNLSMGEKLPSKRNFAKNLGISTITVENAYAQLIAEGYIYSIPKRAILFPISIRSFLWNRCIPLGRQRFFLIHRQPIHDSKADMESLHFAVDFTSSRQIQNIFPFLSGQGSSGNCSVTVSRS
ncbi:MAG: GntR family transcriptional regulator [Coprococcus sp.]